MTDLHERLSRVRKRQGWTIVLRLAAVGLLTGATLATGAAIFRLTGAPLPVWIPVVLAVSGAMLGAGLGMCRPRDWRAAATAVDNHYGLKDRAATALSFLDNRRPDTLHRLQIEDAVAHLGNVDARQVAPYRFSKTMFAGGAVLLVMVVLLLIPSADRSLEAAPVPANQAIVREAEDLEQRLLEQLQQLNREREDPVLDDLVQELQRLVREMKQPGVDVADALAKLSEMQAAITDARAEMSAEAVEAALRKLADALSPAKALEAVVESLRSGEFAKAADQLEKLDASQIDPKQSRAVAEELKNLAAELKDKARENATDGTQEKMSDAAQELAEGLEEQNDADSKDAADKLAGVCRQQSVRQDIAATLAAQLAMLARSKRNCVGNANGGENVNRSDSPKDTWGRGASKQPLGEQTQIDSARRREELTGVHGAGPSEREVSRAAEGREQATRATREQHEEYRKRVEAVLQSEDLPLGHRETIRRYFESIRPEDVDGRER